MIESFDVTFAPFVNPEKPQVSPRPAARFIKERPAISTLGYSPVTFCSAWTSQRGDDRGADLPVNLIFFDPLRRRKEIERGAKQISGFPCNGPNDTAHIRGRPREPIRFWLRPSQICNRIFAAAREWLMPGIAVESHAPEENHGSICQRVGQTLAFSYLRSTPI